MIFGDNIVVNILIYAAIAMVLLHISNHIMLKKAPLITTKAKLLSKIQKVSGVHGSEKILV